MPFADESFIELQNNRTKLQNITCPYCGIKVDRGNRTREHVVGKNFLPKGLLLTGWYLEVWACNNCNQEKSDLEDDISAITLLPDLGSLHDQPNLSEEALRKAKGAVSQFTKKRVAESHQRISIDGNVMSVAHVRLGLMGPPQIDPQRLWRLAEFHVKGFFYLVTYDETKQAGCLAPGDLYCVNHARRSDWGNTQQRWFAELTSTWHSRVEATLADGFFQIAIRRAPSGDELWSCALEWNKAFRIVGFFGDPSAAHICAQSVPSMHPIRTEMSLNQQDDRLFLAD